MLAARRSIRNASRRRRENDELERSISRVLGVMPGARKHRLGHEGERKKRPTATVTCSDTTAFDLGPRAGEPAALRTGEGALHSRRRGHARLGLAANDRQGRAAMLLTRDEIRHDKSFGLLTEAILERDQPRTTDLFFRMVTGEGRSVSDALSVVTAAEAPFVQVPSHINMRAGQITLLNNDHTILGIRTTTSLAPFLPETHRLLPLLQSVWYIPAGLDIWNQLLGKYPGRYATMQGMEVPPRSHAPGGGTAEPVPI